MKPLKLSIVMIMAIAVIAMTLPNQAQGQDREQMAKERKEMGERIKASKIAFITEQVDLSPEEAQTFWPLYNEMEHKRENITHNLMKRFKDWDKSEEVSEEQAKEIMQQRFAEEQALLDLKKEYHEKFTEVLPATRVLKLYEAEHRFRGMLMERLRGRDGEKRPEREKRGAPERENIEPR